MQEETHRNPFQSINNLKRVEFNTRFKNLPLLDLIFEDIAISTSCYELFSETVDSLPDDLWKFVIYYNSEISKYDIANLAGEYIESEPEFYSEEEKDWVSLVQENSKPTIAGQFFVASSIYMQSCPDGLYPIQIDAGMAFGTGEHQTTSGCLEAISSLNIKPSSILDVGSGTGVLAIAAKKKWPLAQVFATEIDEVALEVGKKNALINEAEIKFDLNYNLDSSLQKYDLIVANILLSPLLDMAEDFSSMIAPNGILILSGFIKNQENQLVDKYKNFKFFEKNTIYKDDWVVKILCKNQ